MKRFIITALATFFVLFSPSVGLVETIFFDSEEEEYKFLLEKNGELADTNEAIRKLNIAIRALDRVKQAYRDQLAEWDDIERADIAELKAKAIEDVRKRGEKILKGIYNPNVRRRWKEVILALDLMRTTADAADVISQLEGLQAESETQINILKNNVSATDRIIQKFLAEKAVLDEKRTNLKKDIADNTPGLLRKWLRANAKTANLEKSCKAWNSRDNRSFSYENGFWGSRFDENTGASITVCRATERSECKNTPPFEACKCKNTVVPNTEVSSRLAIPVCGSLPF